MTEPAFKRSPSARIVRSAHDEIKAIRTLLADVYRDAGDGRTLLRELVQNADDAQASRLAFAVVDKGLPAPQNTLLEGPGLLVVNDGPFREEDQRALHQALGDAKAADTEKVGRFGVGLKSVFHVCEAFVYLGAEPDPLTLRPGSLNPWAGTGRVGVQDPLHPDWDTVEVDDAQALLKAARDMLGSFDCGLLLWFPLRLPKHLNRGAPGEKYGVGLSPVALERIVAWFEQPDSLALLLAQCGHLRSVEALRSATLLSSRTTLMRVERPCFGKPRSWVGRHSDDTPALTSLFRGTIVATGQEWSREWSVAGVDAVGHEGLRETRGAPDWPRDRVGRADGHTVLKRRKALAHAAITVLREPAATGEVRLRWAAFLPLDDAPAPRSGTLVESAECAASSDRWDIVMHGYYWPSHDRRSIPGVTDDSVGDGDRVRARWNRGIRDELMLPLLPRAIEYAFRNVPPDAAQSLLAAVAGTKIIKKHPSAVTKNHVLLPVVTEHGIRWNARRTGETRLLPIPSWNDAPGTVRKAFMRQIAEGADVTFIDADSPRVGGTPSAWTSDWIRSLLKCVSVDLLQEPQGLAWVEQCVGCVLERRDDGGVEHSTVVANWLAQKIGEGALTATTDSPPDTRQQLKDTWGRLCGHLPHEWIVHTPVGSQRAVAEIAADGAVGAGLMPIPFGPDADAAPSPAPERLVSALRAVGGRLLDGHGTQSARDARLILAEALLAIRGEPIGGDLARLPLIRALRLPEGVYNAWSASELRRQAAEHRVFSRRDEAPSEQGDTGRVDGVAPAGGPIAQAMRAAGNRRRAVTELAGATDTSFWLVRSMALATNADVPLVTNDALADALLHGTEIANAPDSRIPLLKRLAAEEMNARVGRAIRVLLTGMTANVLGESEIYHVRSGDTQRDPNRRTLDILLRLRGQPWRAADPTLVNALHPDRFERLKILEVDPGVLQLLLQETLDASSADDWLGLEHPHMLHLLKHLHGTAEDDLKRWRALPLHRRVNGDRGPLEDRPLRASSDGRLPPALETEVPLLEPDAEVEALYRDIPLLDDDGILRRMLESDLPDRFFDEIIRQLRAEYHERDRVILPNDPELRVLLKDRPWLPGSGAGPGIAPGRLLCLPEELLDLVVPLAATLGERRLSSQVAPDCWSVAKDVVHEIIGRPSSGRQIERLADGMDTNAVTGVDAGSYVTLPSAECVDEPLIEDVLRSPLADSHPGWNVIRTAAAIAQPTGRDVPRAVLLLARALCAPVPADRQLSTLMDISSSRPVKDSPTGRLFRRFVHAYANTDGFFEHVLPDIILPTQDGQWRPASEIARSSFGVARRHRVLEDYRRALRLDDDDAGRATPGAGKIRSGRRSDSVFAPYFKPWENRLKHSAVGALLSMFGNGNDNATLQLAQKWLGDTEVAYVRRKLTGAGEEPCSNVRVFVSGSQEEKRVTAVNILDAPVMMDADRDNETIFATDPEWDRASSGFWNVRLRHVEPLKHNARELGDLLAKTVERWAVKHLKMDRHLVAEWWERWGTGSQAQVEPVRASILAHLPLTLRQLDVHDCPALQSAVSAAGQARRKREQAAAPELQAEATHEKQAFDHLASLIETPEHSDFVTSRVRQRMEGSGYTAESTLLELVQNADDALVQAREIAGGELSEAARRVVVRVDELVGQPTAVELSHFGRPINDTGGAGFPAGQERGWDQDLYNMMLMNLTAKPGESSEPEVAPSTTGCFGLGFKSVHLISDAPSVVSGFIAFSIAGGLLPKEEQVPGDPDLEPVDGQHVTRFRLPLRSDVERDELLTRMFRRFRFTRPLLPAFTREIREIVVDGWQYAGVSIFDGAPIVGALGWSVARTPTELPNFGPCRVLRFRLREDGTAALVLGIRDGKAAPFPNDIPFLWNVTPTSEHWGCGYAVNGPFKLDHGRTHVALDHEDTRRVARQLGQALGKGLVALHDALANNAGPACGLPGREGVATFTASLWKVLSSGIDTTDDLRRAFLDCLHGHGRGISAWMAACSVVPSELPAPFREQLPALVPNIRIARVPPQDRTLWRAVAEIGDLAQLALGHRVVSDAVAELLRQLPNDIREISRLEPTDLFSELAETWDHRLTPPRLHALRPLAPEHWKLISADASGHLWSAKLVARSVAGEFVSLRELLLPGDLNLNDAAHADQPEAEESKRAAFAPDTHVLDRAYIAAPEDAAVFRHIRTRLQIDAATMAAWFTDLADAKRAGALRYLLHGSLKSEVLEKLVPSDARPSWLNDREDVRRMVNGLGDDWQCQSLLSALFPEHGRNGPETPSTALDGPDPDAGFEVSRHPSPEDFFERLQDWWDDPDNRRNVFDHYEGDAWPGWLREAGIAESLRTDSDDHWLALFVLGACRGLGRSTPKQHQGFLEAANREGWWKVFKRPNEPSDWMEVLRSWQDSAVDHLEYSYWMSLFPTIYLISRYLREYRGLLRSADRRPDLDDLTRLLAPRSDPALSGAGRHFDAPPAPLNMGLHWILRELVRLKVLAPALHLLPHCWVPSEQVFRFLAPFGIESPDGNVSNSDKARAVYNFLERWLRTPHLHYAFDIPLCHVDSNEHLQRYFGLQD